MFFCLFACAAQKNEAVVTLPATTAAALPATAMALPQKPLAWSGEVGNVDAFVSSVFGIGRDLFAVGPIAIRHSSDDGAHWTVTRDVGGTSIWGASVDELWLAGHGVLRSTDRGNTWTRTSAPSSTLDTIGGHPNDLIAGGIDVLFRSTDHGATWTPIQYGIPEASFMSITTSGPDVFVVGREQVKDPTSSIGYHTESIILRSSNGATFTRLAAPQPGMTSNEESRGVCFTSSGKMFLAMSYAVYASPDRGATWQRAADVGTEVLGIACRGHELMIVGRNKRFLRSSDDGTTFVDHELDGIIGPPLIPLIAAWIGADGTALVAGEAYAPGVGTLLLRAR